MQLNIDFGWISSSFNKQKSKKIQILLLTYTPYSHILRNHKNVAYRLTYIHSHILLYIKYTFPETAEFSYWILCIIFCLLICSKLFGVFCCCYFGSTTAIQVTYTIKYFTNKKQFLTPSHTHALVLHNINMIAAIYTHIHTHFD